MLEKIKNPPLLLVFFVVFFALQAEADIPNPDHFGVFLVNGGNLIELQPQAVNQKNLVGYLTVVLIGLNEIKEPPVASESSYFIIYGQEQPITDWKITRLEYHSKYKDAMIKPDPFQIDMWLPDSQIPSVIGTLEDLRYCFTLTPRSPLAEGIYALHFHSL
ncbi:MAG: hypothetical protein ACPLYF_02200, partial [Fervidobacterium sp.]